jgi:DNA-binding winged helix-turn-helix (wHTH) protein
VIILSARPKVSDRIQSLHLGADDYVTKPFSFQELSARVNAVLRRKADPSLNILRVADLELEPVTRRAMRSGRELKLSSREFHLLHLLMRRAGTEVSRQELLQEVWGSQPGSDSNLVDVYVNYLRRKIEHFVVIRGEEKIDEENKLIHTIRGVGYRIGPEAAPVKGSGESVQPVSESVRRPAPMSGLSRPEQISSHQTALRALVSSVAHDLAQPLTGVRCFLEVAAMRKGNVSSAPSDLKGVEQQADRAIVLTKTITALVREIAAPSGHWVSLHGLLEQIFEDFAVLFQSGLLTLERRWDALIQVTSSPVLQQLLSLLIGKLAGKNPKPITLTVTAGMKGGRCDLEMRWAASEQGSVQDAETTFFNDFVYIQEMVSSIGGEISLEGETGILLKLPATLQTSPLSYQHSLTDQ